MNLRTKIFLIVAALLFIPFSVYSFFGMNCFITIIFNYESKFNYPYLFGILPHLITLIEIATFTLGYIRYVKYDPKYHPYHIRKYSIQAIVYSVLGLIFTILGGTVSYHTFLFDNPNPGILIIFLVNNSLLLIVGILGVIYSQKKILKGGYEKAPSGNHHRFISAVFGCFIFFALNRFGAFLCSFIFMDYNYFGLLFPFFISLIGPFAMLVLFEIQFIGGLYRYKYSVYFCWGLCFLLGLGCGLYTIIMGLNNPLLISLSSMAMPLERIATLPIDAVLLFGLTMILPLAKFILLFYHRKDINKETTKPETQKESVVD